MVQEKGSVLLRQKALSGFVWTFLGTGIKAIIQMVVLIVLARILSPRDFGIFSAATVVLAFCTVFVGLGISQVLVQKSHLESEQIRTAFTLSLLFDSGMAAIIWITAPVIGFFFQAEELTWVLRAVCLVFPIEALSTVAECLIMRDLRFQSLAVIDVLTSTIGYGLVAIIMALLGMGVWSLVIARLIQGVLKTSSTLLIQRHTMRPLLDFHAIQDITFMGGGYTLAKIFNYMATQGDNIVVGRFMGLTPLGYYGRAYNLMMIPVTLIGQVSDRVFFPTMATLQNDQERLKDAYVKGTTAIAILTLPSSVVFIQLAPYIVSVLLGNQWSVVIVPFQILAAGIFMRTVYKMGDSLARAKGAVYQRAWRQGVYAFLIVVGTWMGHFWGLEGVAIAVLSAITINCILMTQLSLQILRVSWLEFMRLLIGPLALSIILGIESYALLLILEPLGLSNFLLLLLAFGLLMLSVLILTYYLPQVFLGRQGRILTEILRETWIRHEIK